MKDLIAFLVYGLLCFAIGSLAGYNILQKKSVELTYTQSPLVVYADHDSLTLYNVKYEINRAGIMFPSIALAQIIYETGWLGCENCSLKDNNLFGFCNKDTEYLKFMTWQSSIYYYSHWQYRYAGGDYYEFLRKKWGAKDMDQYIKTIKRIEKQIKW